ncbi:TetR/AcrR family transcriptional regulator [Streptomyces arenae]|uniref:TetR/AcrR family transcriptional regulator n=1 Tax=Streptomyces arenae TaxID=29301 RepID=UPI00265A5515|nr:TetR/AcrR family transcriptional regulator [Streptomyces arenae]MCG7207409.1 TetR/AcrR family transcriptional regulator [Streptomyces arenae]
MKREQQILRAAEKLFYERSFDGVGVDAIGKEAGVTGSAIYRHFESKDEILEVLFDQAIDALLVKVGEPEGDPREELARLVNAHIGFALSHERLAAIWSREVRALSGTGQRNFLRRQHRYVERWVDCLAVCYPRRSRDELVSAVRAVHGLMMSDATRPPGGKRAPQLHALLVDLALAALEVLAEPDAGRSAATE